MATLTTPATLADRIHHLADTADLLGLPQNTGVTVPSDVSAIHLHPQSQEDRRRIMGHPVFAGVAWDFTAYGTTRWSRTTVRGHGVTVYTAREVDA